MQRTQREGADNLADVRSHVLAATRQGTTSTALNELLRRCEDLAVTIIANMHHCQVSRNRAQAFIFAGRAYYAKSEQAFFRCKVLVQVLSV